MTAITVLDTAVIGAGAAGLIVGKLLTDRGQRIELFDDHPRVGDTWRERYRSLRIFSPRRFASLPGLRIEVGRFSYPTGQEMGDYLERYAQHFRLPVRTSSRVAALTRRPDGLFRLELANGDEVLADRVVITAGAHRIPVTPAFAAELDPAIRQLHSLTYRGPEQLLPGPVLVVGAANSGTDIALEAAQAGHSVTIAGRHPGHVPADIDTPIGNILSGFFLRRLLRTTIDTEKGRAVKAAMGGHGVMLVRNSLSDLEKAGVVQVARIASVVGGRPVTADGLPIDATTVVWCTGSHPDLGWIDIDGVRTADGRANEVRGLVASCPGLGFVGMPFQYSIGSGTLPGMVPDAEYVVRELLAAPQRAQYVSPPAAA